MAWVPPAALAVCLAAGAALVCDPRHPPPWPSEELPGPICSVASLRTSQQSLLGPVDRLGWEISGKKEAKGCCLLSRGLRQKAKQSRDKMNRGSNCMRADVVATVKLVEA